MKSLTMIVCLCASALALSASGASAAIVCNREGDCWHTKARHQYRPEFQLRVHGDNWKWHEYEGNRYRWREHDGRGYWRKGVWIGF